MGGIKIKLDFDYIANNRVAVHCDTEKKANEFIKKAHEAGCKGIGNRNFWKVYYRETCYEIATDCDIFYSGIDYFKNKGYEIIEYVLDAEETPLPKLCELLGVDVNEEFIVEGDSENKYKITGDGKFYYKNNSNWLASPAVRTDILYNPNLIIKVKKYPDLTPDDKIFLKKCTINSVMRMLK